MHLKKCAGCARAIVESTAVCQYCGHAAEHTTPDIAAPRPGVEEDPFAFLHDEPVQDQLPIGVKADADATRPAAGPEPGAAAAYDVPLPFAEHASEPEDDWSEAEEPSLEPQADEHDDRAHVKIVAVDDDLPSLDELWKDSAPSVPPTIEPEAADRPEPVAPAPAPAVAAAAKKGRGRTVVMGLAAGVVLIVAALGVRGTASPTTAAAPAASSVRTADASAAKPVASSKPKPKPAPVGPLPTWNRVSDGRWVGRDRRSVALELNANEKVAIWMRQVRPVLVVRCLGQATDVFVFTQTAAKMEPQDENHTVRVGLDGGEFSTERWADSEEHDALFAPDGTALAQQLMHSRTLRFGFTPHNAAPVVAEFNVAGLGELLAPTARQCGWKK